MRRIAAVIALIGLVAASGCAYGPGVSYRRFHPFAPCVGCEGADAAPQRYLATAPGERISFGSTVVGSPMDSMIGAPCDSCSTPAPGPILGTRPVRGTIVPNACDGACGGTCGRMGCRSLDVCGCGQGCVGGCLNGGLVRGVLSIPIDLVSRLFSRQVFCGDSCGDTYWGDWYSYPPACKDPCDNGACGGCSDCGSGTTVPMGVGSGGFTSTQTFAPQSGFAATPGMNFLGGGSIVPTGLFGGISQRGTLAQASTGSSCSSCQSGSHAPVMGSPLRPIATTPIAVTPVATDLRTVSQ